MSTELVVDCSGDGAEPVVRDLTAPEIERRQAERAAWAESAAIEAAAEATRRTLTDEADRALAGLRVLASSNGTLTAAQLSQGARLLARCMIVLIRLHIHRLDAAD